jgi:hypothetical protein
VAEGGGRIDVVDPEVVALTMRSSKFARCAGDDCNLELAGVLGATLALMGSVHSNPSGAVLEVKLFEIRERRLRPLAAESATAPEEVLLLGGTSELVRKVVRAGLAIFEDEARARMFAAQAADWESTRESRAARRTYGWWTFGGGVAVGAAAGAFGFLASKENGKLQTSLPTAADIKKAQDSRASYQRLGVGLGVGGGALALAGLGIVLFSRDPGELRAAAIPVPGGAAMAVGGRF